MRAMVWVANIAGWPVAHLVTSKLALSFDARWFAHDGWLFAERRWERGGRFYSRWLGVRRWKQRLPDGAGWLGGFGKKRLAGRDTAYLQAFLVETRRAEFAHWCMFLILPVFFLWNPPWACGVMTAYAVAANLPCIVAQRYNRASLRRLVAHRSSGHQSRASAGEITPARAAVKS